MFVFIPTVFTFTGEMKLRMNGSSWREGKKVGEEGGGITGGGRVGAAEDTNAVFDRKRSFFIIVVEGCILLRLTRLLRSSGQPEDRVPPTDASVRGEVITPIT